MNLVSPNHHRSGTDLLSLKIPSHVFRRIRENPDFLQLPLEAEHGWRSSPDEGGHTHCSSCVLTIYRGDPVVGCYLKYISVVFCPQCVADNPAEFRRWLAPEPGWDNSA